MGKFTIRLHETGPSERVFSVSQVGMYMRCPLAYRFRYVDRIVNKKLPGILWAGIIGHGTLSYGVDYQIRKSRLITSKDLADVFDEYWSKGNVEEDAYGEVRSQEVDWKNGWVKKDDARVVTRRGVLCYRDGWFPKLSPQFSEQEIKFSLPSKKVPGREHAFVGYIDIATKKNDLIDIKFKGRKPDQGYSLQNDIQLSLYCVGYLIKHGILPIEVQQHAIVGGQTVYPYSQRATYTWIQRAIDTAVSAADAIEAEAFLPTYHRDACGYCDYKHECSQWGTKVTFDFDRLQTKISKKPIFHGKDLMSGAGKWKGPGRFRRTV